MDEYVTKSQFAEAVGKSPASITKAIKKGIFGKWVQGEGRSQKIHLEQGIRLYKNYASGSKHSQNETIVPTEVDSQVVTKENLEELEKLMQDEEFAYMPPLTKMQTVKVFWDGKLAEMKVAKEEGKLIELSSAKSTSIKIFSLIMTFLDNLPNDLKTRFPNIDDEVIEYLENETKRSRIKWAKDIETWGQ